MIHWDSFIFGVCSGVSFGGVVLLHFLINAVFHGKVSR